jgi:hypothetical protein
VISVVAADGEAPVTTLAAQLNLLFSFLKYQQRGSWQRFPPIVVVSRSVGDAAFPAASPSIPAFSATMVLRAISASVASAPILSVPLSSGCQ